ncbi:MAG: hypothetical protein V4482_02080 [Pseudomonadota bacterium]
MGKWLTHFLQKTCQTSTDKTDTMAQMSEASVMSASALGTFEENKMILSDVSVMSAHDLGTFAKNNAILGDGKGKQHVINMSSYTDFYNERAAIYEFEARDVVGNRREAEWLAMNDVLEQFIEDTQTSLQSKKIPTFLYNMYEATQFNLK